jgi:uncharacterized protein (DUF1015 family)
MTSVPSSLRAAAAAPPSRGHVPQIRPFRALRFDADTVGDIGGVVAPPYDVIDDRDFRRLADAHPANVVRLDRPTVEPGEDPDERYRRAARTLAAWRSDGTLRKDPHPSIYVYEQTYRVPGAETERTQRGFFGRLRLETFGEGSSVLPHERTLAAPKEDRYRLLRATGVNTSPVVGLYEDGSGRNTEILDDLTAERPDVDIMDSDDVRHRLWAVPAAGPDADARVDELVRRAGATSVTIADGHHRYETALRYRDERRMTRSCEEDPAFDYLLMLLLEAHEPLTVLPTHRVVRDLGEEGVSAFLDRTPSMFTVRDGLDAEQLRTAFGAAGLAGGGAGRFGLWTRSGGALLTARREAFEAALPAGGEAVRRLDVTLLGIAIERLGGIDAEGVAAGRVAYTKSVDEAIDWVESHHEGADLAVLLEPTPVKEIAAVARDGDVMPQKSTYFYPKALTGLVINPHEW